MTVTGNTVIDALYWVVDKIKSDNALDAELESLLAKAGYDTGRLKDGRRLVLITGHRRENFGDGFIRMCRAIKALTEKYPEVDFVYPMHLNPNVRRPILFDGEIFYCADGQRGHTGGSSGLGQTCTRDARHDGASGSLGGGDGEVGRDGL